MSLIDSSAIQNISSDLSLFKLVLELGGKGYIVTRRNGVSISIPECGIVDLGPCRQDAFLSWHGNQWCLRLWMWNMDS